MTNLQGLAPKDVGFWGNSRLGDGLYREVIGLLDALETRWEDGLRNCPDVKQGFLSAAVHLCSVRIYFRMIPLPKFRTVQRSYSDRVYRERRSPNHHSTSRPPPLRAVARSPKVRNNFMVEKVILNVGFGGASSILRERKNGVLA